MSTSVLEVESALVQQPVSATVELQVLPAHLHPNIDHIITEDGAPVDSVFAEKQQRLLTEPLYTSWHPGHPFIAMANVGLFFTPKQPPLVPDTLLSLDVHAPDDLHRKENRSYFVWEYGKPPNVVIEIVSNQEGGEDSNKLLGYERIGIAYYAIFDPNQHLSGEVLRVFQIHGMKYERIPSSPANAYSLSGINLGITLWRGQFEGATGEWLRWTDSSGAIIPTGAELAEFERQRADAERTRADAERSRADLLAEQLRKMGVQPEK